MAIPPASWPRRRVALRRCRVEDDREGQFHTQVFERSRRYEAPSRSRARRNVRGRSEHPTSVGEVAQTLMGLAPSASAISRLNRDEEPIATQQSVWHHFRCHNESCVTTSGETRLV
jgi:hypothetical protein